MLKNLVIFIINVLILSKGKKNKSIYNNLLRNCKLNNCANLSFIAENICYYQCIDIECFMKYFSNNLYLMGEIFYKEEKMFEICVKDKYTK